MKAPWLSFFSVLTICLSISGPLISQEPEQKTQDPGSTLPDEARITTPVEVRNAIHPTSLFPLRVISYPHRKITGGMESGLVYAEEHKVRERYQAWINHLRSYGVILRFGGMGEGSGFGGGASYFRQVRERHKLQLLGLLTFRAYQELDFQWSSALGPSQLFWEASYQWRPQENYYGPGHDSQRQLHANFALRQSWAGIRWELRPAKHFRWGILYKQAWITALPGKNSLFPPVHELFGSLPGYGSLTHLQSPGIYFDMNYLRSEYLWGGAAHWGASYQQGLGSSQLQYAAYETQLEGRAPIVKGSSVLVGEANFQLTREGSGSDPVPFYLLPHIGGSSTLRGYPLDRFYGRNLALLSLEYRIRIHPNFQTLLFFDEGQVFNRTADLSWLNWHRNYGFGFRVWSVNGVVMRLEFGWSTEGFQAHLTWGNRERPPLRDPIRYGGYKR
jgi:hypothetical protein